jgi:hypothetical protein
MAVWLYTSNITIWDKFLLSILLPQNGQVRGSVLSYLKSEDKKSYVLMFLSIYRRPKHIQQSRLQFA